MDSPGLIARSKRFARRYPFIAFLLVVLANVIFWALVFYVAAHEYLYAKEIPGFSNFGPPLTRALVKHREAHPESQADAEALLESLKAENPSDRMPISIQTGETAMPLAACDIEDEFGRGVLFYYPGWKLKSPWRKDYAYGLITYQGQKRARYVRLYRFPEEDDFSTTDIAPSVHKRVAGFEPPE